MGVKSKGQDGFSSGNQHRTAFNLHRNKAHTSSNSNEEKPFDFPAFPKPASDATSGVNSGYLNPSNVKPGVVYADEKPEDSSRSNEKPSDSSFFDATRNSENDESGFELIKPDSKDKPSYDTDSFSNEDDNSSDDGHSDFESVNPDAEVKPSFGSDSFSNDDRFSEDDRSDFERVNPDTKDKSSYDSDSFSNEDRFSEDDHSGFGSLKPYSKVKPSFDSDKSAESGGSGFEFDKSSHSDGSSSRFDSEEKDVEDQKREFSGRSGVKPQFPTIPKFPSSSAKPFLAGVPKIKFVMGNGGRFSARGPLRKQASREGPTPYTIRDRIFYLSGAGDVPVYGFSSLYGPSASLLYDGGDVPFLLDDAEPNEGVYVLKK